MAPLVPGLQSEGETALTFVAEPGRADGPGLVERPGSGSTRQRQWPLLLSAVVLVAVALFVLTRFAGEVDYQSIRATVLATPPWRIAAAVLLTAASFGALTLYDVNAFRAIGSPRRWREVAPGAFAAFAVSQSVGFGPLSGGAVRLRFYLPLKVTPAEIAGVVAFVTISFGLGLAVIGAAGALAIAPEIAGVVGMEPGPIRLLGGVLLVLVLALMSLGGRSLRLPWLGERRIRLPDRAILLRQILVTAVDIVATAGVLWVLLPSGGIGFPAFVPIFAAAVALGVLSHVPAGLGVFEAIVLAALRDHAPTSEIIAALALYRVIYSALPVAVAAIAIAVAEIGRLFRNPAARVVATAFTGLAPQALAALALVLGTMLVFSGVTPANPADLAWLSSFLPLQLLEGAHFLASVLGAVLLVSARGLAYRLDGAWLVAMGAAAAAVLLSLAKALALVEAATLTLFVLLLLASRRRFTRPAAILNQFLTLQWTLAIGAVLVSALIILLFVYDHADLALDSWARFEVESEAPRGLRALVGAAFAIGIAGFWSLLKPVPETIERPTPEDLARAALIVENQPSVEANLVKLGDKSLMFSADGRGFIMYGRQGRSWIALFDPVGPRDLWPGLVWRFVETARRSGGRAAFYQVPAESLSVYADAGFVCLKLGEEARIDLTRFSLEGPDRKDQRYVLKRGRRDGLEVAILERAALPPVVPELERISNEWLRSRGGGEKAFSLGAFFRPYILGQRIAVLRLEGRIIAFATLMETALKEEASLDLMRHLDDIPGVSMEFLFLRLIEHFQGEGVRWFSLGMAPLAGLSASDVAPMWHRIGNAVFEHGARHYNFKGLRGFKAGFQPVWRPRYLAVSGGLSPALVLLDAARLISGGLREKGECGGSPGRFRRPSRSSPR